MTIKLTDLIIDDELKHLLPPGSDHERAELLANIIADKRFTDPLIVWLNHGIVVDGQTRFELWQNDVDQSVIEPPEIVEKHFASKDEVKAWMIRHQNGRRNWSTSQRAMMAAELSGLKLGENQHRVEGSGNPLPSLAEEFNVSVDTVKQGRKVAVAGSAALNSAVKAGDVRVNDAAKIVSLPKAAQTKAVNAVKAGKSPTVAKAAGVVSDPQQDRNDAITGKTKYAGDASGGTKFDPAEFDPEMAADEDDDKPVGVPKHLAEVASSLKVIAGAVTDAGRLKAKIEGIIAGPGGGKLAKHWSDIERCLEQVQVYLKCYRFWSACPECKITDKHKTADKSCKMCGGHGWIAKTNGLSAEHKLWLTERGVKV